MADKNTIFVADSLLPVALTTVKAGLDCLPDGFDDVQYGMGVLDGEFDHNPSSYLATPTDFTKEAGGLDLSALMSEGPVNDLSWLSDFEPDPERLPDGHATLNAIPQLQEQWGGNRDQTERTAHEIDLAYLRAPNGVIRKAQPFDKLAIAQRAMRRVAALIAPSEIEREAVLAVGGDVTHVKHILRMAELDRGLAGNVFVRLSSMPGYDQGKWKDFLRKHAHNARYLVADEQVIKAAAWIENGRCVFTSKQVVSEIPWITAYAHYAPRLKAAGRPVLLENGNHREALQAAFLADRAARVSRDVLPTHEGEIKRLGGDRKVDKAGIDAANQALVARHAQRIATKVDQVKASIAAGERGGILRRRVATMFVDAKDQAAAIRLLAPVLRDKLEELPVQVRMASENMPTHEGEIKRLGGDRKVDKAGIDAANQALVARHAQRIATKVDQVKASIAAGERGGILRRRVATMFVDAKDQAAAIRLLAPVLRDKLEELPVQVRMASENMPTHEGEIKRLGGDRKADKAGIDAANQALAARVTTGAVTWVRIAMNEGFAGKTLDDAISHRFTESLLKEAGANISRIRSVHEGLAGHRYIDTSAYASQTGSSGCETGGLKHRANPVKMALAMDRCGSCAMASVLPNGAANCSVYNKVLVRASDFSADQLRKAKAAVIKSANAHDAEITASMFAPRHDPAEFGLHNTMFDSIRPDDLPEDHKIADIVLGGLIF